MISPKQKTQANRKQLIAERDKRTQTDEEHRLSITPLRAVI